VFVNRFIKQEYVPREGRRDKMGSGWFGLIIILVAAVCFGFVLWKDSKKDKQDKQNKAK
jgi:hypothetical protein